jgi:hypothetical protein
MSDLAAEIGELARNWMRMAADLKTSPEDSPDHVRADTLESCAAMIRQALTSEPAGPVSHATGSATPPPEKGQP